MKPESSVSKKFSQEITPATTIFVKMKWISTISY